MFKTLIKVILFTGVIVGGYLYLTREKLVPTIDLPAVEYQDVEDVEIVENVNTDITVGAGLPSPVNSGDPVVNEPVIVPEPDAVTTPPVMEGTGEALPAAYNLAVPFTSQAPKSNWALPYQEACEEASIYMVAEYYKGTSAGKIDPNIADTEILKIVDFETTFLGTYLDTTAAETASIVDSYYGYNARVIEDPAIEDIQRQIAAGRPVIVPAAGQELGNPNFSGIGPLYHMLVVKGYTATQFITNDPGTRNGENYGYDFDVLMKAMGDWNNGDPAHGAKRILVITPN